MTEFERNSETPCLRIFKFEVALPLINEYQDSVKIQAT